MLLENEMLSKWLSEKLRNTKKKEKEKKSQCHQGSELLAQLVLSLKYFLFWI